MKPEPTTLNENLTCSKCNEKIKVQKKSEVTYKKQLIETLIRVCIDRLKTSKCEPGGARSGCKDRYDCQFKPLYLRKKLGTTEKKKLKGELKGFFEKTVHVKPHQPYCSKGQNIYCMECGVKAT